MLVSHSQWKLLGHFPRVLSTPEIRIHFPVGTHGGGIQWKIAVRGGWLPRGAALPSDREACQSEPQVHSVSWRQINGAGFSPCEPMLGPGNQHSFLRAYRHLLQNPF